MNISLVSLTAGSLFVLAACASHDHQDRFLLGQANQDNIAVQSVRDTGVPNAEPVRSSPGSRAARAIRALDENLRDGPQPGAGEGE